MFDANISPKYSFWESLSRSKICRCSSTAIKKVYFTYCANHSLFYLVSITFVFTIKWQIVASIEFRKRSDIVYLLLDPEPQGLKVQRKSTLQEITETVKPLSYPYPDNSQDSCQLQIVQRRDPRTSVVQGGHRPVQLPPSDRRLPLHRRITKPIHRVTSGKAPNCASLRLCRRRETGSGRSVRRKWRDHRVQSSGQYSTTFCSGQISQFSLPKQWKLRPVVNVTILFLEEIQISPKLIHWKKFVLMSEPALKCENNAIFNQNYTLKLVITFNMTYSCCFSLRGNLNFPDFLKKYIITSTAVANLKKALWLYSYDSRVVLTIK